MYMMKEGMAEVENVPFFLFKCHLSNEIESQRGTHAVVGVATMDAPLHSVGYQVNNLSLGIDTKVCCNYC